jgi:hypothetical protein
MAVRPRMNKRPLTSLIGGTIHRCKISMTKVRMTRSILKSPDDRAEAEAQARYTALTSQGSPDSNLGDYDRAIADFNERRSESILKARSPLWPEATLTRTKAITTARPLITTRRPDLTPRMLSLFAIEEE